MYESSSLRYAHTMGYTSLIYSDNGEFIMTCGSDGDIRKWRSIEDDDPNSNCLGEFVMCLAQKDGKLLAATDRNTVQSYTFPAIENDGCLLRFTAPVICMKVQDQILAAGSEDTNIQVKMDDNSPPVELLGHKGPVLSLDIHPNGSMLASVGGDGILKIWNLNKNGEQIKSIFGLSQVNSFENAKCLGTPCFHPIHGNSLAYVKEKEIIVVSTSNWENLYSLNDAKLKGNYTCCQFSKDGLLLAVGTDKGEIGVIDFLSRHPIRCESSAEADAITALAWHPTNRKELAYCDASGQLGIVFSKTNNFAKTTELLSKESEVSENDFDDIEFEGDDDHPITDHNENDADDDDDADNDNVISLEKLKNSILLDKPTTGSDGESRDVMDRARSESPSVAASVKDALLQVKQQIAFQPGSTPMHLENRYLVWNSVGIITSHTDGNEGGSIDVEFHDTSVYHTLHIPNYSNHNMASLSTTVVALSAQGATKLVCIALAAFGNKEWSMELPDCESVEALVATNSLVAAATSMQFLRIFTVMGTQREVISIPGPVVCLAGYENRILICYHSAPASIQQQQYISAMLLQINGLHLKCQNITVPLPPDRQLRWVGFSDCGSPLIADSMGLVQLFNLKSNCWYPVCDTMKSSSSVCNNYFVIALSERSQILQAVLCRASTYPMTNPRPMLQELPLQVPLCDLESEKSTLEDKLLRANILNLEDASGMITENGLQLFGMACRSEAEARAKELVIMLASTKLLSLAVKYANKIGRIHLADRLSELLPKVEEVQKKINEDESLVEQTLPASPAPIQPRTNETNSNSESKLAPKTISLSASKKSTLKRFALNNSLNNFGRNTPERLFSLSNNTETQSELNFNIPTNDNTQSSQTNSVNPFAAKRKISDTDNEGVVLGSEKLKNFKKS